MNKQLLGYVSWNKTRDMPANGTRRFKVWTSESEASRDRPRYIREEFVVKPVYVEVADEG